MNDITSSMFRQDLEFLRSISGQQSFLKFLYEGRTKNEAVAFCRINPAVLFFVMKENPEFKADIEAAEGFHADMAVDKLENLQDEIDDPLMLRAVSDNIKWIAERRARERYGAKIEMNVNHTVNLREALDAGIKRIATLPVIDCKPLELIDAASDTASHAQLSELDKLLS